MKISIKKISEAKLRLLTIVILLVIIPACDDPQVGPGTDQKARIQIKEESFKIGPDGGTIEALNGNVTIEIPKGALLATERFTIEEGPIDDGDDFIIKSIILKPHYTKFAKPARVQLRYDMQLSIGIDPSKAKCLAIYHFKNEAAFDKRMPSDMIWINKCHVNTSDKCLEIEIYSGGVFAIGEDSLGKKVPDPF